MVKGDSAWCRAVVIVCGTVLFCNLLGIAAAAFFVHVLGVNENELSSAVTWTLLDGQRASATKLSNSRTSYPETMTEEEELEAAAQRVAELWTARLEGQRSLPHILASNLLAVVACLLIFPGFGYAITRGSLRKQPHVFAIRLAFLFGPVIYVGGQEARVALALACDGLPCDFWYYAPLEALGIAAALLVPVGFYCVYGKESINSGSVRLDPSYVKYLSKHPALWVGSILMVVGAALIEAS